MNSEVNMPPLKSITTEVGSQQASEVSRSPRAAPVGVVSAVRDVQVVEKQQTEKPISNDELESVVTDMNSVAQNLQRDLLFSVDEKSGGTFVKVIDKETDEVVREIPSQEIRAIKSRLEEVAGLIFKESV